jgi:hypothetical protein
MSKDPELLKDAEVWAELFFSAEELADLLGLSVDEVRVAISEPDSELGAVIRKGRLLSQAELRRSILKLAKQGSGPAQAEALRLLKSME